MDKIVLGENSIGHIGKDKMARNQWHEQNGTDKMVQPNGFMSIYTVNCIISFVLFLLNCLFVEAVWIDEGILAKVEAGLTKAEYGSGIWAVSKFHQKFTR